MNAFRILYSGNIIHNRMFILLSVLFIFATQILICFTGDIFQRVNYFTSKDKIKVEHIIHILIILFEYDIWYHNIIMPYGGTICYNDTRHLKYYVGADPGILKGGGQPNIYYFGIWFY